MASSAVYDNEDSGTKLMMSSILNDFSDIKSNSKISDDKFELGLKFALMLSEKKDRTTAYMEVYGVEDRKKARVLASQLLHTKWVNDIINRMITSNHILYCDKHYSALDELYRIGMEGEDEKNRVQALKSFIDATKKPELKAGIQINMNLGSEMVDKLEAQLAMLADNAKIYLRDGSIADAEVIK